MMNLKSLAVAPAMLAVCLCISISSAVEVTATKFSDKSVSAGAGNRCGSVPTGVSAAIYKVYEGTSATIWVDLRRCSGESASGYAGTASAKGAGSPSSLHDWRVSDLREIMPRPALKLY